MSGMFRLHTDHEHASLCEAYELFAEATDFMTESTRHSDRNGRSNTHAGFGSRKTFRANRAPSFGFGLTNRIDGVNAPTSHMLSKQLLSGNEAVALSAFHRGFTLGTGYPGTPSTEILESLARLREEKEAAAGLRVQWAANEKVALEVALGVAFAGARSLVTMKHVGVNVAADVLFSAAYTDIPGALVLVSADDPGMASSQNEQDNRRYAVAAAVPVLEPCDSQQAYEYVGKAVEIAERWQLPVMLRMTTRICHSKSIVTCEPRIQPCKVGNYQRNIDGRVMLPAYARLAHRRLREKLTQIADNAESLGLVEYVRAGSDLGIICSGATAMHVQEAVPNASLLILGTCHPLPVQAIERWVNSVERCIVVEEGDPVLFEAIRSAGILVETTPRDFRFGELNVQRVRSILNPNTACSVQQPAGKAPELCQGCPHRAVFEILAKHDIIVSGDIGCYTLAALPPMSGMDTVVCMGASIGVGIGLRYGLSPNDTRNVVSVIGDSTFVHSGMTGLVELVYNPPETGHVVIVLDNGTTAMTGLQEHAATGRTLTREPCTRLAIEAVARAIGVSRVEVVDPRNEAERFEKTLVDMLQNREIGVIVARRECILAQARNHAELRKKPDPKSPLQSSPAAGSP